MRTQPVRTDDRARTASRAAEPRRFAFMQFSDVHVGNEANRPVHERLAAAVDLVSERKPAFVIDTGDLTAHPVYGPEPEYLAEFDEYRRYTDDLTVPLYVVPGNHDIGYSHPMHPRSTGEPWGDHTQLVAVFREKIGPLDQSFEREGVRFVLLNNNPRRSGDPGHLSASQLAWTEDELKRSQPTFIFCHVEVLERGAGAPWGDSSQALSDLCRTYGVIAVAYGHRHELHVTEREGTVYIMCPDLKVQDHRGVLEYRVCADHFELWHVDVCARTETRLAHHHYGR